VRAVKRIVVKLGTGVLTSDKGELDRSRISLICSQIAALRKKGTEVFVVSSGAVGLGMASLGLTKRPKEVSKKQACASIGQSKLMQVWQQEFSKFSITVGQVLLTHDDLRIRSRYLGVQDTLHQLIAYDSIPVINENDTVSAAEIKFGDNDTLSAMVASLVEADHLIILSTAPGLIDMKGSGKIIPIIEKITPEIEAMAEGTSNERAVGGMVSKISAAKLATRAGCGVFIASAEEKEVLPRLLSGQGPGSFFVPSGIPLDAKKRWLAYFQRPTGTLTVHANAVGPLSEHGRSLLAVGVVQSVGLYSAGDVVNIADPKGIIFARGTTHFSSNEMIQVMGKKENELKALFPKLKRFEVVHRNELALL
jgi:glutamate 5-kinase